MGLPLEALKSKYSQLKKIAAHLIQNAFIVCGSIFDISWLLECIPAFPLGLQYWSALVLPEL